MKKFDTKIQYLKYKVLREVAGHTWTNSLHENLLDIPKAIVPGKIPTMRCCVYKERAILGERVKVAMCGYKSNPGVIQVLDIACDECPVGGYEVTSACRGCLAQRCKDVCKFGAISFDHDHTAHIDKTKCKECGACSKVCPYSAIRNFKRPCETACKVKAISMGEEKQAVVDSEKCISCGACVYQCPFGAITDKSFILNAIDILKKRHISADTRAVAVIAPSAASQFSFASYGQVVTGLRLLGFDDVAEAALGADIAAAEEAKELAEKGFLISSCCPAFVSYVKKNFPQLEEYISSSPSPMTVTAKLIKEKYPASKVVFIGPCTAKKAEMQREDVRRFVDAVITFEELQALFDSRSINIETLEETKLNDASGFGRSFARSGGASEAIAEALKEQNISFNFKPCVCGGIEECRTALLKKSKEKQDFNFIEGMACVGGCIGGAGNLTHGEQDRSLIDKSAAKAEKKTVL
ncbi:MAG: monomeric [FeFe] hydrogenase [Firmicutes bacterium]|nr:monomeric [FeFe] hydrogenase [Candidatus Colimorpha enterica]